MAERAFLKAVVRGRVQGVYFRRFALDHARTLGLRGFVRNLSDGASVEVQAEGERERLELLLRYLAKGPPGAWVAQVERQWGEAEERFADFRVVD